MWLVRAGVFVCVTLLVIEFLDVGIWQIVHHFAVAVSTFPYGAQAMEEAPRWAVLFVLVVLGSVLAHGVIVVLEIVSDVLSFCSKMLAIFWHGGIINADKYDSEEEEPRRFIGLQERFAAAERRAAVRFEIYTRHQAIKDATSGITEGRLSGVLRGRPPCGGRRRGPASTEALDQRRWLHRRGRAEAAPCARVRMLRAGAAENVEPRVSIGDVRWCPCRIP